MARYAEALFRHRIRFATLLLITVVLAGAVALEFATYRVSASLSVADPSSFGANFVPVGWSQGATPAQNVADSAELVIKNPEFSSALAGALSSAGVATSSTEAQLLARSVAGGLKVGVSGAHVVTLGYTCDRSSACVQVLSAAITTLRQQLIQAERNQADATTAFWTGQLGDARSNLASAEDAVKSYAAANPGAKVDASSTDPQVQLLLDGVKQWQAKVSEAQDNLSLAQYSSSASARLIDLGTAVLTPPTPVTSSPVGDPASLRLAALVFAAGLLLVLVYLAVLGWTDKTARDPRTLERRLGVPVVATIPTLLGSRGV